MAQQCSYRKHSIMLYFINLTAYQVILEKQILLIKQMLDRAAPSLIKLIKHTTSRLEIVTENNINLTFTLIYTLC